MSESAPCPSLADLLDSAAGSPALEAHVAGCPRCRALRTTIGSGAAADRPATAQDAPSTGAAALSAPVLGGAAGPLVPGQIIVAAYADLDEFLLAVVLDSGGDDPTVAPLSDDAVVATDLDLVIDQVVLGYPAIAEAWNTGPLLAEQVRDVVGCLGADDLLALETLVAIARRAEPAPDELPTGAPVLNADDPRLRAREAERERVEPFWQPARLLAETPTFGALVRNAQAREDVADDELAVLVDEPQWLERLEQDELDLQGSVSARMLLRLLDRLHVALDEGTARLVGAAVAATCAPAPSQELRLARRRTRSRWKAAPSPEERRAAAQRYVDGLWREAGRR